MTTPQKRCREDEVDAVTSPLVDSGAVSHDVAVVQQLQAAGVLRTAEEANSEYGLVRDIAAARFLAAPPIPASLAPPAGMAAFAMMAERLTQTGAEARV